MSMSEGEYSRLLADAAESALRALNEVRLPLHILTEHHFGELNENQEEMLVAARSAADVIGGEFEALQTLAQLDGGILHMRADRVQPPNLVRAILPSLLQSAEKRGISLHYDIDGFVSPIVADASRLQTALLTLLGAQVGAAPRDAQIELSLAPDLHASVVRLAPAISLTQTASLLLARRVIAHAGGRIDETSAILTITLGQRSGPRAA